MPVSHCITYKFFPCFLGVRRKIPFLPEEVEASILCLFRHKPLYPLLLWIHAWEKIPSPFPFKGSLTPSNYSPFASPSHLIAYPLQDTYLHMISLSHIKNNQPTFFCFKSPSSLICSVAVRSWPKLLERVVCTSIKQPCILGSLTFY